MINKIIDFSQNEALIMADEILYQDYIDRSSPIPLYQQVSAAMVRRIAEEEWRVGD